MTVHTVTVFFMHGNPWLIYTIVALILLLESSAVPIANNTLLLLTGAMASLGHLDIFDLAVAAIIGSIAGACLAYTLGAWKGQDLIARLAKIFRVDMQKVLLVERWYKRSGLWMIFLSRMTPYVRPFACFPAGSSRMRFAHFLLASSAGSIIWCIALLAIGWNLGRRYKVAIHLMQSYTVPAVITVVVLLAGYFVAQWAIKRYVRAHAPVDVAEVPAEPGRDLLHTK